MGRPQPEGVASLRVLAQFSLLTTPARHPPNDVKKTSKTSIIGLSTLRSLGVGFRSRSQGAKLVAKQTDSHARTRKQRRLGAASKRPLLRALLALRCCLALFRLNSRGSELIRRQFVGAALLGDRECVG